MARPVDEAARELLRTAAEGVTWTPANHRLCPADVRQGARARTLMMGGRRADGGGTLHPIDIPEVRWMGGEPLFIPRDIWGLIFSFLLEGRGPRCAEVDEAAFAAGIAAAGSGGGAR